MFCGDHPHDSFRKFGHDNPTAVEDLFLHAEACAPRHPQLGLTQAFTVPFPAPVQFWVFNEEGTLDPPVSATIVSVICGAERDDHALKIRAWS